MAGFRIALASADQLGEAPCWDAKRQRLLRVDMGAQLVHSWAPATGVKEHWQIAAAPTVVVPAANEALLVAVKHEIVIIDNGVSTAFCRPAGLDSDVVLNDGKCDPAGRLWIGSYSRTGKPAAGLYRIDVGGSCERMRDHLTISNGLAWNLEGDRFYHVDTPTRTIRVAPFDASRGLVGEFETLVDLHDAPGVPDGIATDVAGGVWVAMFGGSQIRRYLPDGALERVVDLPVTHPTSVAFGSADLRTLYVTTSAANHRLTAEMAATQPLAGAVFAVSAPVSGTPVAAFGQRISAGNQTPDFL